MQNALNETNKRREKQLKYNQENNIKPQTIRKDVFNFMNAFSDESDDSSNQENNNFNLKKANLSKMRKEMLKHAANLDFEKASEIRDQINYIEKMQLL